MDGMHTAFPGLPAGNVFAPRSPAAAAATSETVQAWAAGLADIAAAHSRELAAIIVEPILQGAGGMHAYPAECLTVLRQVADRHGLLLIFDEIATGLGGPANCSRPSMPASCRTSCAWASPPAAT